MGGSRLGPGARVWRPTALLSAVATFLGALFICLGPAGTDHARLLTTSPAAQLTPAYSCPFDSGSCGVMTTVTPAVLTPQPPDAPPLAEARLPRLDRAVRSGAPVSTAARPRAPDLHVLQVLRT
ncbi:hypothetical protein GCM10010232_45930 [Streptomyces amakusaensis]|uniref:DUF2946 domain-containing protein n=1 Tax=Streptomyces amakusaensis TaxID=67271 RepID=A0ABW0ANB2_9ACTN